MTTIRSAGPTISPDFLPTGPGSRREVLWPVQPRVVRYPLRAGMRADSLAPLRAGRTPRPAACVSEANAPGS